MKLCLTCLSLSIVLLCESIQPFERDRQEMCVIQKNEVSCSYVAQKVKMLTERKLWPKSLLAKTRIFSPCLLRESARRKIRIFYNFIGFFFNHVKNNRFFNRISLLLADFSWKFVTKLLTESSIFCETIYQI